MHVLDQEMRTFHRMIGATVNRFWSSILIASLVGLCVVRVADAEKFLRLENRDHVQLNKTRGFLNLNGTFTIESWVRWDDSRSKVTSLFSDDHAPGDPNSAVRELCGWILRVSPIEDARFRYLELVLAGAPPGKRSTQWNILKVKIPALPVGEPSPWHHIAICKTPQLIVLFLDGKPVGKAPCAGARFAMSPSDLFFGVRPGVLESRKVFADYRAFRIVDRIVYKRAFKPQANLPKQGRTILELDFGQGAAGVIPDIAGGNHSGVISGGTWHDD